MRWRGSDGSTFGKPLDCVLVVPADGGFPRGRRWRGDVMRVLVETGGVVGQHQIEVGDVEVRRVPVDQRDPLRGHADVAPGWAVPCRSTVHYCATMLDCIYLHAMISMYSLGGDLLPREV